MATILNFNAHDVEPSVGFETIPAGNYLATITASEMRPTKSGNGGYLQLTFTILEGDYKGRVLWSRLNLQNPSAMAVKIAQSELSAICRAVGVMQPRDSVELHNIPLLITVKCVKRAGSDELSNEIKGYEAKPQYAAPTSSTPVSDAAPWKRG